MVVYKFGGGILKDAEGVRQIVKIVSRVKEEIVIVVSAFGKTTNAFEKVLGEWFAGNSNYEKSLEFLFQNHIQIASKLFPAGSDTIDTLNQSFAKLRDYLLTEQKRDFDYEYDQIVSYGEIWSTLIVAGYLLQSSFDSEWVDIRNCLITDDNYRDANILWGESNARVCRRFDSGRRQIYVTQGFIGGTAAGHTTTLGREGSDYTAAVLANMLDTEKVIIWKDVPGILNADPKWLNGTVKLDELSYKEAVEMTFSGAKVIHPKTIKPLYNKNIPLFVRCFINPDDLGTLVTSTVRASLDVPVFVKKEKQMLLSVLPRDFSFVMGDNLGMIFHLFMIHKIKVNLVQASAVSINVCVDDERGKIEKLVEELGRDYRILYNEDVEILTIMRHTREAVAKVLSGREILLEQKTRRVVRYVVRSI